MLPPDQHLPVLPQDQLAASRLVWMKAWAGPPTGARGQGTAHWLAWCSGAGCKRGRARRSPLAMVLQAPPPQDSHPVPFQGCPVPFQGCPCPRQQQLQQVWQQPYQQVLQQGQPEGASHPGWSPARDCGSSRAACPSRHRRHPKTWRSWGGHAHRVACQRSRGAGMHPWSPRHLRCHPPDEARCLQSGGCQWPWGAWTSTSRRTRAVACLPGAPRGAGAPRGGWRAGGWRTPGPLPWVCAAPRQWACPRCPRQAPGWSPQGTARGRHACVHQG